MSQFIKNDGFTFLEISIVIAILAIVLALAVPNYLGIKEGAQDTAITADIASLENAFSLCSVVNSTSMKDSLASETEIPALSDINGNVIDPNTLKLYSIKSDISRYYKKLNKSLDNYLVDESNDVYYQGLFSGKEGGISAEIESDAGTTCVQKTITGDSIPARKAHTALLYNGKMIIFAGSTDSENLNDCYEVNLSTYESEKKTISGASIPVICRHSAVLYNDKMIVFGGSNFNGTVNYSDLYEIDLNTYKAVKKTITGDAVPARNNHTAVVLNDKMIIFGGVGAETYNDCYEINLNTFVSDKKTLSGDSIPIRSSHSAVIYNGNMIIYGGYSGSSDYDDCYSVNLSTYAVTRVTLSGDALPAMRYHRAVVCNGKMIIFGGTSSINDIFSVNLSSYAVTRSTLTNPPAARNEHSIILYNAKIILFDGINGTCLDNCYEIQ
ncbi:MAG: kelch repeat-containing protein [Ignavibacteriales bacterium]